LVVVVLVVVVLVVVVLVVVVLVVVVLVVVVLVVVVLVVVVLVVVVLVVVVLVVGLVPSSVRRSRRRTRPPPQSGSHTWGSTASSPPVHENWWLTAVYSTRMRGWQTGSPDGARVDHGSTSISVDSADAHPCTRVASVSAVD
jgi:hypothetical protein